MLCRLFFFLYFSSKSFLFNLNIVSYNLKIHLLLYLFTSTTAENWKITLAVMIQREIYRSCCRLSWQGILMFSGRKACKTDMGYKVVRITYWLYFMLFCKLKGPILTTNTYRLHLWCFCLTLYLILIQRYVSCHLQQVFALG